MTTHEIPLPPPPTRGRLLSPDALAAMLGRSPAWCRRMVPGKVTLGHRTVLWHEADVLAWLARHRDAPPSGAKQ